MSFGITRGGNVFIAPQYILGWNKDLREGGAVPDFVAIYFGAKEVIVVEVTTRATWKPLLAKIMQRQSSWYQPISRKLLQIGAVGPDWHIRSLAVLRKDVIARGAIDDFASEVDVTVVALDDCMHQWEYWSRRVNSDLPGQDTEIKLDDIHLCQSIAAQSR